MPNQPLDQQNTTTTEHSNRMKGSIRRDDVIHSEPVCESQSTCWPDCTKEDARRCPEQAPPKACYVCHRMTKLYQCIRCQANICETHLLDGVCVLCAEDWAKNVRELERALASPEKSDENEQAWKLNEAMATSCLNAGVIAGIEGCIERFDVMIKKAPPSLARDILCAVRNEIMTYLREVSNATP